MRRFIGIAAALFLLLLPPAASLAARGGDGSAGALPSSYPAAGELAVWRVAVHVAPDPRSRVITVLDQFRPDFRPEVVMAIGGQTGADGRPWYHINLQMRPNGTYGWIPANAAPLAPMHNHIVVDRGSRRLLLYHDNRLVYTTKVAVGAPGRETPLGHFYVTARFIPDDPFLGVFAVETSAYSKLTEWPGGGKVGLHGTSEPQLLGQAVSHGCVRMSNAAARVLERYALLGTPIDIVRG